MTKLTKTQIDAIKRLLDSTGELPPEWRWKIFPPEKQEYELVYAAKQREEDIIAQAMAVPLQTVRTFNNGSDNPQGSGWYNRLIFGENLQALKSLLSDPDVAGNVKLIYIDPPFATKQDFAGSQDQKAYRDKLAGAAFVEFLRRRLVLMRELLSPDGSIFVHLDSKKGHYIKVIMDEIFGEHNFVNEIVWHYRKWSTNIKAFQKNHDTIYWYAKKESGSNRKFKVVAYEQPSVGTLKRWKGRKQRAQFDQHGRRLASDTEESSTGAPISDVWKDIEEVGEIDSVMEISIINPAAVERVGYPTQKPEALLDRIIRAVTEEGDLVLDAFAGSGTTCAVAEKTRRRWVSIDGGKLASYTVQKRLLNLKAGVGNKGRSLKASPFVLQNAGLYDFAALKDLPWEDWRFFALQLFECRDNPHRIGGLHLDGEKGQSPVLVYDWKANPSQTISEETIQDIHAMVGKKIGKKFYIIAPMMSFDFFQDYVDLDGVRYYALRIPYAMIQELHRKDFEAVLQAREERNVNDVQEAYGFSFMVAPEVQWEAKIESKKGDPFTWAVLRTKKFISNATIKGTERQGSFETLAMLMLDLDYDGAVFDLDVALFGDQLESEKYTARFAAEKVGDHVMAIWVDHHGNEGKAVIARSEFGLCAPKSGVRKKAPPRKKVGKTRRAKSKN